VAVLNSQVCCCDTPHTFSTMINLQENGPALLALCSAMLCVDSPAQREEAAVSRQLPVHCARHFNTSCSAHVCFSTNLVANDSLRSPMLQKIRMSRKKVL